MARKAAAVEEDRKRDPIRVYLKDEIHEWIEGKMAQTGANKSGTVQKILYDAWAREKRLDKGSELELFARFLQAKRPKGTDEVLAALDRFFQVLNAPKKERQK